MWVENLDTLFKMVKEKENDGDGYVIIRVIVVF